MMNVIKFLSCSALIACTVIISANESKTWSWKDAKSAPEAAQTFPTSKKPWKAEVDDAKRDAILKEISRLRTESPDTVYAFPAAKDFPGIPPDGTPIIQKTIMIDPAVSGWKSTGLYALPGVPLTLTFPATAMLKNDKKNVYSIIVGCHTDRLNTTRHKSWTRLPEISYSATVSGLETRFTSPMGGLIYINVINPLPETQSLEVTISNVVHAPMFVKGKTTPEAWKKMVTEHPAPWGELVGERAILSMATHELAQVKDPAALIECMDSGMKVQDWLIAWDVTNPERLKTPMRFVVDRQISAGGGHSGYPAMGLPYWSAPFMNMDFVKKGSWGFWHEMGHNHQTGAYRLPNMGEVQVNIFSLVAQIKAHGAGIEESWGGFKNIDKTLTQYFSDTKTYFESTGEHALRLWFFVELIKEFGFDPFREMSLAFAKNGYANDASEVEKWSWTMSTLSKATGKNLAPYFEAWRIPLTESAKNEVKSLKVWMPSPDFPQKYMKKG